MCEIVAEGFMEGDLFVRWKQAVRGKGLSLKKPSELAHV